MAAITNHDMDRAVVTFCYEPQERINLGVRFQSIVQLPWAWVLFPDAGDRYVSPLTGTDYTVGLLAEIYTSRPYVQGAEYMQNAPFPHELPGAFTADNKAGVRAVHFFGNI